MLDQFQRAFSDMVASPELVSRVRKDPVWLRDRYDLTELEWRRLASMADQPGMECSCVLYRANRLAPLAVNLPELCKVLAPDLRALLSEFWAGHALMNDNVLVECYDFCRFVVDKIDGGFIPGKDVLPVLEREGSAVAAQLVAIYPDNSFADFH